MKRLISLTVLALFTLTAAQAQSQFGIIGGFTSSSTSINTNDWLSNTENVNLFHVGVAYKAGLPAGFALQPELSYQVKGAKLSEQINGVQTSSFETKSGFIELNLDIQWGLDLIAFRPFVFASPFVGYQLSGNENYSNIISQYSEDATAALNNTMNSAKNKLEYGFGFGVGLDMLDRLQIKLQWFKNLGNLYDGDKMADIEGAVLSNYKDIQNFSGMKVTAAIFF